MILGVALVVDELNKGHRLVFRYPEAVPNYLPPNTSKGLHKLYEQYFSISQDNFAKLFRPKNALLNRVLDLTIDDLHFTSYPCPSSEPSSSKSNGPNAESEPIDTAVSSSSSSSSSHYVISMFNIVVVSVTGKAMKKINPDIPYRCQLRHSGLPGADPVAAALGLRGTACGVCTQSLRRVVEAVSLALYEQEKKCRYLSEQAAIILHLIDVMNEAAKREGGGLGSALGDAMQLSTAASRDSTDEDSRVAMNQISVLEEQAGLLKGSVASHVPTVVVVASFDRTTRSASNASILAMSEMSASHRNSTASELPYQATLSQSYDELQQPLPEITIPGGVAFSSDSSAGPHGGLPPPHSPLDGPTHRRLTNETIQLPPQDTHQHPQHHHYHAYHRAEAHSGWGAHLLIVTFKHSSLANELRMLYHSLIGGPCVGVSFNRTPAEPCLLSCPDLRHCEDYRKHCAPTHDIRHTQRVPTVLRLSMSQTSLSNQLSGGRPRTSFSLTGGSLFSTSGVHEVAKRAGINLETDALLGLAEAEVLLRLLREHLSSGDRKAESPTAASSDYQARLFAFVELLDPSMSLFDYSLTLNEPIEELVSMATLLIGWGLAEVVSLLCHQSCFQVQDDAPTEAGSLVSDAFESLLHSFNIDFTAAGPSSLSPLPTEMGLETVSEVRGVKPKPGTPPAAGSSMRKSTSSSSVPQPVSRIRADSDGNIKPTTVVIPLRRASESADLGTAAPPGKPPLSPVPGESKQVPISLDRLDLIPQRYSLGAILSLFDGTRSLREVIGLMDRPLQRYGCTIVVFLLRWHMLAEIQFYVVNCAKLPTYDLEELRRTTTAQSASGGAGASGGFYSSATAALSGWSIGGTEVKSAASLDFGMRFSFAEANDQLIANTFVQRLSTKELAVYDKLSPHLQNSVLSSKVLGELLWSCQVSELEWARLLPKLPHLRILKKVNA